MLPFADDPRFQSVAVALPDVTRLHIILRAREALVDTSVREIEPDNTRRCKMSESVAQLGRKMQGYLERGIQTPMARGQFT